ncbi:MAG: hypothetical protein R3Y63_09085 [Eubacteriales bacterium]
MFYENQPPHHQENYKKMLSLIGNLTLLFSESNCPYLPYRAHENIFCKYFEAENLSRSDCSADAKQNKIGIGLKTWMGNDDQKVAEFGKLRETYKDLTGLDLVKKVADYRNVRIRTTKNMHGIDEMIYHIVKRIPNTMQILECAFDTIDIDNISVIADRGNVNNTYFTDKKHTYHFSSSKNTLYMIFDDCTILDQFEVEIMADPYAYLMNLASSNPETSMLEPQAPDYSNKLCLRLYSFNKKQGNFVAEKSGLNQWNAGGRSRNPNEVYIPYPAEDRRISEGFFPPRDTVFDLQMPDGTVIPTKVCQDDGKAIMSNPNKIFGEWLLRTVFELPENTLVTYEMLEKFGIDSVIFTKSEEGTYKIDFSDIGTYEDYIGHVIVEEEEE